MAFVTVDELKDLLGCEDLYPDADLQLVCDAATELLTPFLLFNRAAIVETVLTNNVAVYRTLNDHKFNVGDSITVTNSGTTFNGVKTISAVGKKLFMVDITHANIDQKVLYPYGQAIITSQITQYDADPNVRLAAQTIAVDFWDARQSAQGVAQAVDYTPAPYRMGRSVLSRVIGLIGNKRNPGSMVG